MTLLADFAASDRLLHRISGPEQAPVLVYVPGIHGDWTPMVNCRGYLARRLRLVELAYPWRARWLLDDFADALAAKLDELGIESAHLLAESFGSIVGWQFALTRPRRVRSLVLAGGFCRPPWSSFLPAALATMAAIPPRWVDSVIGAYIRLHAGRRDYDADAGFPPFSASRGREGWRACRNRLRVIRATDLRRRLGEIRCPVAYVGGGRDLVVPVRREIRCLRESLHPDCRFTQWIVEGAPHPILPARPQSVANWIADRVEEAERMRSGAAEERELGVSKKDK